MPLASTLLAAQIRSGLRSAARRLVPAALLLACAAPAAFAQSRGRADEPTAFSEVTQAPQEDTQSPAMRVLSAICWYIPNRVADISDIPRIHLSIGDGMGLTIRATKMLYLSSFQDDAYCLGWAGKPRQFPIFGESIEEQYLGFLAAQAGEIDRDPSEVGLSAHFAVIGANIAVSLGETVDALVGLLGVDLSGDDHGPTMYNYVKPEPAPAAPNEIITTPAPPAATAPLPPANIAPPATEGSAPGSEPTPEASSLGESDAAGAADAATETVPAPVENEPVAPEAEAMPQE